MLIFSAKKIISFQLQIQVEDSVLEILEEVFLVTQQKVLAENIG